MKESLRSFEELNCWKACTLVRRFVMDVVKQFPKEEKYSLIDNMTRAARSSTQNIAEGFGRFHYQENIQFCRISRGSIEEILDDINLCLDEGYGDPGYNAQLKTEGYELIRRINGYIVYLRKVKRGVTDDTLNQSS